MATTEENRIEFLESVKRNGPYTLIEAIELMKHLDSFHTVTSAPIIWQDAKTKKPVYFSY